MPIYEYECKKCKAHTEVYQKITDKPRSRCPKCKGRLEKLMSASAIRFKGKGWYVTDYASKSKQAESSDEKKTGSTDTAPSDDKAKTKDTTARKPASSEPAPSSKPSGGS
jgi:putative FmdB family regulatory protein